MDTLDTTDTTAPVPDPYLATERAVPERTYATTTEERRVSTPEPVGPFSFAAGFLGWCVAAFLTLLLMGVVLAILGSAAYNNATVLGSTVSISQAALRDLTAGGIVGSLIAIFVAYFVGGYNAGRIDRWHGIGQGAMVVGWTIAFGIVAGVAANAAANVASSAGWQVYLAPYAIDWGALTTGSVVALVITLLVMLGGACLGGWTGERWLRREVDYTERRRVGTWRGRRV